MVFCEHNFQRSTVISDVTPPMKQPGHGGQPACSPYRGHLRAVEPSPARATPHHDTQDTPGSPSPPHGGLCSRLAMTCGLATSRVASRNTCRLGTSRVAGCNTRGLATSRVAGRNTRRLATSRVAGHNTRGLATSRVAVRNTRGLATSRVAGRNTHGVTSHSAWPSSRSYVARSQFDMFFGYSTF